MAQAVKAVARPLPAFKLGKKSVFLPSHVITFLRKDFLPLNEACFQVPLRFTKFDLRDYLWNLYGMEVRTVRSMVKQRPLQYRQSITSPRVYRPQPLKIMFAELIKPFQWPARPSNRSAWNHELWQKREEEREQEDKVTARGYPPYKGEMKTEEPHSEQRKALRNLAKKMLSGEIKWSNDVALDPRWDNLLSKNHEKHAETGAAKKDVGVVQLPQK